MASRPRDRKVAIVDAAADLFAVRGYGGVGIDDIGAAVGVTGPAIYRHFRGKAAVLDAVVLGTIRAYEVDEVAAAEGIERIVADAVATALAHPAHLATYVRERPRLAGKARQALHDTERGIGRAWVAAIRAAAPGLDTARIRDRHLAALSAMSAIATQRRRLDRPALDGLVGDAMLGVLLAPAAGAADGSATAAGDAAPVEPTRRDEILARALALFRERGFHGVGIDEVGEAAGVTGPTVYFHYGSKVDILLDAFAVAGERIEAGTAAASIRAAASPGDALARLARSYLEVAATHVDLIVVAEREGDAVPAAARPPLAERRRRIRRVWVDVLRRLRPGLDDPSLLTLVDGVFPLMNQLAQRGPGPAEGVRLVEGWCLGEAGC